MRQDKDRSGKWLLTHHGDAILRLAGITDFSTWKPLQPETIAPRRLPDGLIEVRFPNEVEPTLVLVEIETYPDAEVDRQILEDLMLIAVDRKAVPEVVSLVLKPKGKLEVAGSSERVSRRGRTRIDGSWPVVRLWELEAESLLSVADPGLVPWVPLTHTTLGPDALMTLCRDRIAQVPDKDDRAGLTAVTQILAALAFPNRRFLDLFGGPKVMIDSPILDEVKALMRIYTLHEAIIEALEARFGAVPAERVAPLREITDDARVRALLKLAVTCPNLDAFFAALDPGR
jgi:hypothetical protein